MTEDSLVVITTESAVATVTLNRAAKRNALSTPLLSRLLHILNEIANDFPRTRVVVLRGQGPSFCTGADIKEFERWDATSLFDFIQLGSTTFQTIVDMPQPVIAGIHGHALGGGLELALASDIRLADNTATFGFPEINIGGVPGWGGTVRLQEVVGRGAASLMMLSGEPIDATAAESIGLVQRVVMEDDLSESCIALARTLAAKSPVALRLVKLALNSGSPYDAPAQAGIEQYSNLACMSSEERHKSVESFNAR